MLGLVCAVVNRVFYAPNIISNSAFLPVQIPLFWSVVFVVSFNKEADFSAHKNNNNKIISSQCC